MTRHDNAVWLVGENLHLLHCDGIDLVVAVQALDVFPIPLNHVDQIVDTANVTGHGFQGRRQELHTHLVCNSSSSRRQELQTPLVGKNTPSSPNLLPHSPVVVAEDNFTVVNTVFLQDSVYGIRSCAGSMPSQ